MPNIPIACVECGCRLGLGDPGAFAPCSRCGRWVATRAAGGDTDAVIGAVVAIGIGLVVAYVISRLFRS